MRFSILQGRCSVAYARSTKVLSNKCSETVITAGAFGAHASAGNCVLWSAAPTMPFEYPAVVLVSATAY